MKIEAPIVLAAAHLADHMSGNDGRAGSYEPNSPNGQFHEISRSSWWLAATSRPSLNRLLLCARREHSPDRPPSVIVWAAGEADVSFDI